MKALPSTPVLKNGQILSAYNPIDEESFFIDEDPCWPVWIDGKKIPASLHRETAIVLSESDFFCVSESGYVIAHGVLPDSDESGFACFYAPEGTKQFIPDERSGSDFIVAAGNAAPSFACAYEDGSLFLYSIEDGSSEAVDAGYSPGEVRQMVFSESDEYLIICTNNGRFDIWSAADRTRVFSQSMVSLFGGYYDLIDGISCQDEKDRSRLHIISETLEGWHRGFWFTVDTETWAVTSESQDTACSITGKWLMNFEGDGVCAYPVRTLEELAALARSRQTAGSVQDQKEP